jgi:hypothetical protein
VSDSYFREILGVEPRASRDDIKRAYHRLVMENHPDRFPPEKKPVQELAMITLNEAYGFLMSWVDSEARSEAGRSAGTSEPVSRRSKPAGRTRAGRSSAAPASAGQGAPPGGQSAPAPRPGVTHPKDPSYAYYKQGFINFSVALHGIAEMNRKIASQKSTAFKPYRVAQDFANSLSLLAAAHAYFLRVVEEYSASVWCADAQAKLKRIERFTKLYRKILANMSARYRRR